MQSLMKICPIALKCVVNGKKKNITKFVDSQGSSVSVSSGLESQACAIMPRFLHGSQHFKSSYLQSKNFATVATEPLSQSRSLLFETVSYYVTKAGLEHTLQLRLASNQQLSYLCYFIAEYWDCKCALLPLPKFI